MSGEDTKPDESMLTRREALQGGSAVVATTVGLETLTARAMAQSGGPSDEISGVVEDDSGAVQGTTVAAVPHDTSLSVLETTTAADGTYIFDEQALHEGENLYHVIARDGTESDPRRGVQNYPFIAAEGLAAIPDSGISRWELEQNVQDSWGSNDGTVVGNPQYVTDNQLGTYALDFDGDDYVDLGDVLDFSGSSGFSVGVWVKMQTQTGDQGIFSKSQQGARQWQLNENSNEWRFAVFDSAGDPSTVSSQATTGSWTHLVGVYDGSQIELFADGTSQDTGAISSVQSVSTSTWIGGYFSTSFVWNGIIDDPRAYDKALTATEVSNWYNTGSI